MWRAGFWGRCRITLSDNGQITERFQELMNPGQRISGFIESYTGITNAMLTDARPCSEVMRDFEANVQIIRMAVIGKAHIAP